MMATKNINSVLVAIYDWLDQYSSSPNTYRAYFREFERLQTWLLIENLTFLTLTSEQLTTYFEQLGAGLLSPHCINSKNAVSLSRRSIQQTHGVLNRLFRILKSMGFRSDNPISGCSLPESFEHTSIKRPDASIETWYELRKLCQDQPAPIRGARESLVRAFAIAELSFWVSMQRSELAAGVMADFRQANGEWYIAVRRFGKGAISEVLVPKPAMDALQRYRLSRGLGALPDKTEIHVPIISRLKAERAVDSWTITNAIRIAAKQLTYKDSERDLSTSLSPRLLRKYLVINGLSKNLSPSDLAKHVRSNYAVQSINKSPISSTFFHELSKLEFA